MTLIMNLTNYYYKNIIKVCQKKILTVVCKADKVVMISSWNVQTIILEMNESVT